MDDWVCKAGSGLLVPSNKKDSFHLHIVVCPPQNADGYRHNSCVLLSVTTIYEGVPFDDICLLDENDGHPFITHPSYVPYELARNSCSSEIDDYVRKGIYSQHHDCPPGMLKKMVEGITKSIHAPSWINDFKY